MATEFDVLEVAPPAGSPGWIPFELRGQANLCEAIPIMTRDLPGSAVHDFRTISATERHLPPPSAHGGPV